MHIEREHALLTIRTKQYIGIPHPPCIRIGRAPYVRREHSIRRSSSLWLEVPIKHYPIIQTSRVVPCPHAIDCLKEKEKSARAS